MIVDHRSENIDERETCLELFYLDGDPGKNALGTAVHHVVSQVDETCAAVELVGIEKVELFW